MRSFLVRAYWIAFVLPTILHPNRIRADDFVFPSSDPPEPGISSTPNRPEFQAFESSPAAIASASPSEGEHVTAQAEPPEAIFAVEGFIENGNADRFLAADPNERIFLEDPNAGKRNLRLECFKEGLEVQDKCLEGYREYDAHCWIGKEACLGAAAARERYCIERYPNGLNLLYCMIRYLDFDIPECERIHKICMGFRDGIYQECYGEWLITKEACIREHPDRWEKIPNAVE